MSNESLKKLSKVELEALKKTFTQHRDTAKLPRLVREHGQLLKSVDTELESRHGQ